MHSFKLRELTVMKLKSVQNVYAADINKQQPGRDIYLVSYWMGPKEELPMGLAKSDLQ
jgi:hypothetical protein